ncbi:MAG: hypothetical protein OQK59_01230 [Chlorobium sp.]|nr:hypothetical protein [Chlorobium sp.]
MSDERGKERQEARDKNVGAAPVSARGERNDEWAKGLPTGHWFLVAF